MCLDLFYPCSEEQVKNGQTADPLCPCPEEQVRNGQTTGRCAWIHFIQAPKNKTKTGMRCLGSTSSIFIGPEEQVRNGQTAEWHTWIHLTHTHRPGRTSKKRSNSGMTYLVPTRPYSSNKTKTDMRCLGSTSSILIGREEQTRDDHSRSNSEMSHYPPYQFSSSGHSSVVRALNSWSKGLGFESRQKRQDNCLLQGQLSVLTLISVSVPAPCYRSST